QFLAFVAGGKLNKLEISTGSISTVCDVSSNDGGAWSRDDLILLARPYGAPLLKVAAAGGVPAAVTIADVSRGDSGHSWPQWLPDSRRFLYFIRTSRAEGSGVYAGGLGESKPASRMILQS